MKSAKGTHTSVPTAQDTTESREPRLNVNTNEVHVLNRKYQCHTFRMLPCEISI